MHYIYLQQSGKPVEGSSGLFWSLAGVAVPEDKWRILQLRINGLQKSFQKDNYQPGTTRVNANDLLHPRNAERPWTIAYCKGLEKIASTLDIKTFLVVVDKRTTDKPAHPKWLLPLSYHYLLKPISQYLREKRSSGTLVIPPGREEERKTISDMQFSMVFTNQGKYNPIVSSPMIQSEYDAAGLQVADFVATVAKRYHEHTYPKLYQKEILEGYDSIINSHYQGFVKPHTYQSDASDQKGFRIRGYIYLWRREGVTPGGSRDQDDEGAGQESSRKTPNLYSEKAAAAAPTPAPPKAPEAPKAPEVKKVDDKIE
jgi:hypothetical protein